MFGKKFSRRQALQGSSLGFGMLALKSLLASEDGGPLAPRPPHFAPKAKNVIFCYMSGGVSHVDSFDPKPRLQKEAGRAMPLPIERTVFNDNGNIFPSPWEFNRYGRCGHQISDLFPHIGSVADELAIVRSMTAKFMEHAQGNFFFHSGQPFTGFPSLGAWVTYGLGSPSRNLPGFVVLASGEIPLGGVNVYGNGFLPNIHQASLIYPERPEPLLDVKPKESDKVQRRGLRFIESMDEDFLATTDHNRDVEAAIKNYEVAYRMQSAVPELVDLRGESEATTKMYGLNSLNKGKAAYGRQCLIARRLVERGVRFVEVSMVDPRGKGAGSTWDQHNNLKQGHAANAFTVDQPIAALIKDLKARGLLSETLVIWSGEFGRTPFAQGSDGRDHNPCGFSMWMAGGGIKGGIVYGATDEYGYRAVENPLTVYDLHATILHLLGLDHQKLTFRFGGRDFRLTDVHGRVIPGLIA